MSTSLFGAHESIHRNVSQVKMPKMDRNELFDIFEKRLPVIGMKVQNDILERIVDLSQGFPGYTHLIAQATFLHAARRKSMTPQNIDLREGIGKCVANADETIQTAYEDAVRSTKPNHNYREALTACALTRTGPRGFFRATDIKAPMSKIMGRPVEIPSFNRHLQEFQSGERGPVLAKTGKPKTYEYRFVNPLLKPFAILQGIRSGIVDMDDYSVESFTPPSPPHAPPSTPT